MTISFTQSVAEPYKQCELNEMYIAYKATEMNRKKRAKIENLHFCLALIIIGADDNVC